jgi:hypothetical protein
MRRTARGAPTLIALAMLLTACGATVEATFSTVGSSPTDQATPSPSPLPTAKPTPRASIDPQARLTQRVEAGLGFDPPFTLRIPADWTAVLRDEAAFQAYSGNEDFEITFDHTFQPEETVDEGIARLTDTPGLLPGPVQPVLVGGREGKGFVADSDAAVMFSDSGFHTNEGSTLEVIVVPVPGGKTITIFLTAGGDPDHGLESLSPLARRIFKTVEWQ